MDMDTATPENLAGSSGIPVDNLLNGQPTTSSEVPVNNPKKRGRPRKVAAEGEDKRRKQMIIRKRRKKNVIEDNKFEGLIKKHRYVGENVNNKDIYLPDGWKCFAVKRSTGIHKGYYDLLYIAPNGARLRSRNEVFMWTKKNKSTIDPLKFLFVRSENVLFQEENAKKIIFRESSLKGNSKRYVDIIAQKLGLEGCNTVFADRGREFLQDDESCSSCPQSLSGDFEGDNEQSSGTPKKKQTAKPRRVPLDKTLDCLKSPYFSLKDQIPSKPVSIHAKNNAKWIPPRSPYNLIQEDLYHNPWQLLIATIFLNCTTGRLAIPVIHEFLARWPTPHEACSASLFDLIEVIELLGLGRSRAATIIKFSHEYLTVDWKKPTELFGIGKYGYDSYKVFCMGQWRSVESEDKYLNLYINWLHNACSRSGAANRFSRGNSALVPK